jgi:hypothetical protein
MIAAGIYGSDVGRFPRPGDGGWRWLVSVRYAGRVIRWGDGDLSAIELDGSLFAVNLDSDLSNISVTDAIPVGAVGVAPRSLSFSVYMPAGIDVALNERRGIMFSGSEVEVALVPDGGTLSDRCVVLRGFASEPTYGTTDDPVSFTAREPESYNDGIYPPDAARNVVALELLGISNNGKWYQAEVPWFAAPDTDNGDADKLVQIGQVWPRVFGAPGAITLSTVNGYRSDRPGTRAIPVSQMESAHWGEDDLRLIWTALLISYEHVPQPETTNVTLLRYDSEYPNGTIRLSLPTRLGLDHRGIPFTCVRYDDVLAIPGAFLPKTGMDAHELLLMSDWCVAWGAYDGHSNGPNVDGTPAPSAANVLSWMIERSSLVWDVGRSKSATDHLRPYLLAGAIEDTTRPLDWLSDHVFGTLPVFLASGPLGLYAVPVPYQSQFAVPVSAIVVDGWSAVLPRQAVQVETDERATKVAVSWCRDASNGAYFKRAFRLNGDDQTRSAGDSPYYETTIPTEETAERVVSVDLPYVWDDQTAYRVLDWLAWREMKQRRTIAVDVDPSVHGWLSVGDVVTFTSDALHLQAAKCMVVSITRSSALWWRCKVMPLDD